MHALAMIQFVTARLTERKTVAEQLLTPPDGDATPDPERILRELEATRKIVANARTALDQGWQLDAEAREATAHFAVRTLQHLAAIDADHADYDPAWQL